MPTSARSFASPAPSSGSVLPSIVIVPESMVSSRLIARHSVDLPEPRRADDDDDLAAVDDGVDVVQHVQVAEVLVDVVDDDERFTAAHVMFEVVGAAAGVSGVAMMPTLGGRVARREARRELYRTVTGRNGQSDPPERCAKALS